jgi:acid phosphatase type 7
MQPSIALFCILTLAAHVHGQDLPKSRPTPATKATKGPSDSVAVLVGAGDIASCDDLAGAQATAKLLDNIPGTVFAVGDLAYPDGSDEQFANCYGPTWGRFKDRTRPAPGNHEYRTDGASGYVRYFGAAAGDPTKGYYSYDLGDWHIIVLNSECVEVGGCGAGSPQELWLR